MKEIKKPDYFIHLNLPIYGKVGIIEGKGIHYFNAMSKANQCGDNSKFIKFLILELLLINDQLVDETYLNEMSLKDVAYLTTVINTMIETSNY